MRSEDAVIGVIGFGSQGSAHAQNLRDSGFSVIVALPPASQSAEKARSLGFDVLDTSEVVKRSNVISVLVPDALAPEVYDKEILPNLNVNDCLVFAHGFNVHYNQIAPPDYVDVVLVAPKAPGRDVRALYLSGGGAPSLLAVHQDVSGHAQEQAEQYATGIGGSASAKLPTTFQEETETDLFGEQAVLVGGMRELAVTAFDILVDAGYDAQAAYFECIHELKMTVDLMAEHGPAGMLNFCSETARFGGMTRGSRVIDQDVRTTLKGMLAEIQTGQFAREWIAEDARGRPDFNALYLDETRRAVEDTSEIVRKLVNGSDNGAELGNTT